MKLSIIIVNYNTGHLLAECLGSIYNTVKESGFCKVVVIDNNSTDDSVVLAKKFFPQVKLIENRENIGFARANNQAIRLSKSQYILLLNPDTLVQPDAVSGMVHFMDEHPEVGVLGCRILNPDGTLQPSCKTFPTLLGELLQGLFIDKLLPYMSFFNIYPYHFRHDRPREVDWMTGACLMLRQKAIDEVGLLDGNFFLYYEEVDWCYRARKQGWKIYFIPEAQIIHYGGRSTEQELISSLLEASKSHSRFFKKHYSRQTQNLFRAFTVAGAYLRIGIWIVVGRFVPRLRVESWQRIRAYSKIIRLRVEIRIAMDISSISRSKAGVGHYTHNLRQMLPVVNSQYNYSFFDDRGTVEDIHKGWSNIIRKIVSAARHITWEQLILPLSLMVRRIDLLHSPAFVSPLLKTTHSVITIHDMAYYLYPDKFIKAYRQYLSLMVPISARRAAKIIVDSENTKKDVIRILKVNESKIEVVYPAVGWTYRPIEDKVLLERTKKKYNLTGRFILYIGTIEPRKNIIGIIKGYYKLKELLPKEEAYELVIAGKKGWLYFDIFELVKSLKIQEEVIFTDYVPEEDLPFLYNAAELFVYPSLYEGFGLPPLEAMACGTPVITSDISSLPEVVGDAALMVSPRDIDGLAGAMFRVLTNDNLKQELIKKGLKRAKKFNWEETAARTTQVYNKILGGKPYAYRY